MLTVEGPNNDELWKLCVAQPNLKLVELISMKIYNDSIECVLEYCPQLTSLELQYLQKIDPSEIYESKITALKHVIICDQINLFVDKTFHL